MRRRAEATSAPPRARYLTATEPPRPVFLKTGSLQPSNPDVQLIPAESGNIAEGRFGATRILSLSYGGRDTLARLRQGGTSDGTGARFGPRRPGGGRPDRSRRERRLDLAAQGAARSGLRALPPGRPLRVSLCTRQAARRPGIPRDPGTGLAARLPTHPRPGLRPGTAGCLVAGRRDRKSTRLNSSHSSISYAAFCLKKKKPN